MTVPGWARAAAVMLMLWSGMAHGMSAEEMIFDVPPYSEAARAIKHGDAVTLEALVKSGFDVNFEGRETRTPWGRDTTTLLVWAMLADDPKGAAILLDAGADPNRATRAGMTPLIMAAGVRNGAMIDLLLRSRADPNRVYAAARQSALLVALAEPSLGEERWQRAERLVARGANPDLDLGGGDTALISLAERDIWDAALWLLRHGANIASRNGAGMTMPCYLRNSYKVGALEPSPAYTHRDRVRSWLLEHGVTQSRVDPVLHPGWECDD